MYLTALTLTNFRNYRAIELPLAQGLTIFAGPNGAGKSNVLEAIHCLATGRSYRTRADTELRSFAPDPERPYTRVAGDVAAGDVTTTLEVIWAAEQDLEAGSGRQAGFGKRIRIGGAPRRASSLLQHLHVVLFTPHDIALVDGSPSIRRRYLDYLLSRIDPNYLRTLQGYEHVMAERNALLRALREGATRDRRQLEAWNHELTALGATLMALRTVYTAHVAEPLAATFTSLTGLGGESNPADSEAEAAGAGPSPRSTQPQPGAGERDPGQAAGDPRTASLQLRYESTVPLPSGPPQRDELRISALPQAWLTEIQAAFAAALAAQAPREQAQAVTVVGPHRDDITFLRGEHALAAYGSRGEQRLAALTLKLTEIALLHAESGEWPVILLDDFLSELDAQRRQHVLASLAPNVQAFATTSDLQQFSGDVVESAHVMYVDDDTVRAAP